MQNSCLCSSGRDLIILGIYDFKEPSCLHIAATLLAKSSASLLVAASAYTLTASSVPEARAKDRPSLNFCKMCQLIGTLLIERSSKAWNPLSPWSPGNPANRSRNKSSVL